MKKISAILLCAVMTLSLCLAGCGTPADAGGGGAGEDAFTVVASFYPVYVSALNITQGTGTELILLTQPDGGCLHDYQLTPQDLKTLGGADLFVTNGAGMEGFLDKAVGQLPDLPVVDASEGIELIYDVAHDHDHDHEEHDHDELTANAHVWVSVPGAVRQVQNIAAALQKADPSNAERYGQNAQEYIEKLNTLDEEIRDALELYQGRALVTFHESFSYFAAEYGLSLAASITQEEDDQLPAGELAEIVDIVRAEQDIILVADRQNPSRVGRSVAFETERTLYELDSVSAGELLDAERYLTAMRENIQTLQMAFTEN